MIEQSVFTHLAQAYAKAKRYPLAEIDPHGHILQAERPRPCHASAACDSVRALALTEALRWGEPCVMSCHCGQLLWAVPIMHNQQLTGGLAVCGIPLRKPGRQGSLDRRVLAACGKLLEIAAEANLTNTALLAERRRLARREREKAEAIHDLKGRFHDDVRSIYLTDEPALLAAIRRGDRTEARRIINRVLTAIYSLGGSNLALLKSFALELVVMMTRAAVQAGGTAEKILGFNYQSITALAAIPDQEELARWLCDMLEQLIDAIGANTRHPNTVLLARAIEYMEEHLADPLTREQVASVAGLSPSHFSHLMREKAGCSFTELLTRMRVDRARSLLTRTHDSLADIAQQCGFSDQSYFTRVFRKHTGKTPGSYRSELAGFAQDSQNLAP
ncbi:MAG: helix-turn-helix domain-containing protein [Verrucomicrobia bacterium]|nr:MAG: helix-turn-helix domain-containing protein [Verrucomicrobiota bacterium]